MRPLRPSILAGIAVFLALVLLAIAIFHWVLPWAPGSAIAVLGVLGFIALAIESLERDKNLARFFLRAGFLVVATCLVWIEIYDITADRRLADVRFATQMSALARQMNVTYDQTRGIYNAVGGVQYLTMAQDRTAEAAQIANPLKKHALLLAASMLSQNASDELGEPINGDQISRGEFVIYRVRSSFRFRVRFKDKFDAEAKEITMALLRQGITKSQIGQLSLWIDDEWSDKLSSAERLAFLADMLPDNTK